jgi:hypothetical protein
MHVLHHPWDGIAHTRFFCQAGGTAQQMIEMRRDFVKQL